MVAFKDGIITKLTDLGTSLLDGLKELFIPTFNPFDALSTLFNEKFPVISQVKQFVSSITIPLTIPSAPTFNIDFTGFYGGGTLTIFDLSWYAPYRDIVYNLISCLIVVATIVKAVKLLPEVIGGV